MISKCGHDITDPTGGFESDETASELQRAGVGGVDRLPGRAEATCLAPCLTPLTISIADADAKKPKLLSRFDSSRFNCCRKCALCYGGGAPPPQT